MRDQLTKGVTDCETDFTNYDFINPRRTGRASYICPKCGTDISLIVFLIEEAKRDVPSTNSQGNNDSHSEDAD